MRAKIRSFVFIEICLFFYQRFLPAFLTFAFQVKRMKNFFFLFALLFAGNYMLAQDTLRVMHYNLLYYGVVTSWCTNINNNVDDKNMHLRTILDEVQPDIFTVNEISANEIVQNQLMQNTLNVDGKDYYQKAGVRNQAGSSIVNMLYYDSRKLKLKQQYTAQQYVRDIDVYELYYNSVDLALGDTAFVVCVVAHLKAGSDEDDAATRQVQVTSVMQFLEQHYTSENILFMGDFNVYSGAEAAYQTITNYANIDMRFLDPISQNGSWHNNSAFAGIHTQSTNTSSNGCASSGGMDDRFDFILISDEVRFGTNDVRYVTDSYQAFEKDDNRFNGSIVNPANTAVSEEIASALHQMSDHLPVVLDLRVDKVLDLNENWAKPFLAKISPNPAHNRLLLDFYLSRPAGMQVNIFNMQGKLKSSQKFDAIAGKNHFETNLEQLSAGIYLLQLADGKGNVEVLRLVKTR